ncbi:MAG TPA: hypothetical protein DEV97_03865, partial [Lachnospiraceae bacterium]|nr:hypothetical protein [Lachnospiraceae bacterium]
MLHNDASLYERIHASHCHAIPVVESIKQCPVPETQAEINSRIITHGNFKLQDLLCGFLCSRLDLLLLNIRRRLLIA